jgi:transcriptional regulator with XRE-family HTH domain
MNKINKKERNLIEQLLDRISSEDAEKIKNRMVLAAKIDEALKAKNWKKKDFAEALNKNQSMITKWLSGTHNFTADTLWDIERILKIRLIDLGDSAAARSGDVHIYLSVKNNRQSQVLIEQKDGTHLHYTLLPAANQHDDVSSRKSTKSRKGQPSSNTTA